MPRGSVLIFVGGMVHAGGTNDTDVKRKSFLTGYQLGAIRGVFAQSDLVDFLLVLTFGVNTGWLRPENKFFAYKPLHDAVIAGQFSDETAKLLGHGDRADKVHFLHFK